MKNYKYTIFLIIFFLGFCFVYNNTSAAGLTYIPLEPLPGMAKDAPYSISEYIKFLYNSMLGLAVVLAIVKIAIGGLRIMMAGGNPSKRSDAKEDIASAVSGLVLALGVIFILELINPQLVPGNFLIPRITKD